MNNLPEPGKWYVLTYMDFYVPIKYLGKCKDYPGLLLFNYEDGEPVRLASHGWDDYLRPETKLERLLRSDG